MQTYHTYPELKTYLQGVQQIMLDSLTSISGDVEETLRGIISRGGKMLRPAFVILGAQQGKSFDEKKVLSIAAAMEMLHVATLVHDDVIDQASTRRGGDAVHTHEGNRIAIIAGDYLLSRAFQLVSQYGKRSEGIYLSQGITKICEAELLQHQTAGNIGISKREYLRRILGKTALLFTLSFFVGGDSGKGSLKTKALLRKIGYNVGMAFQVVDDILDCSSSAEELGKPSNSDLRQKIVTLPVITSIKRNPDLGPLIVQGWENLDNQDLWNTIFEEVKKGIPEAQKVAAVYTKRAIQSAKKLPKATSSEAIQSLIQELLVRSW